MKARFAIGCASWTDKTLISSGWYPWGVSSAEQRLRYYASRFHVVEVDSTYYALPSKRVAALWSDRTWGDFVFDIKAFRLFTGHLTPFQAIPKDIQPLIPAQVRNKERLYYKDLPDDIRDELWTRFKDALSPLHDSRKLGTVLLQFPPTVVPHEKVYAHLEECKERLAPYELAVEFRNAKWFVPDVVAKATFSFLRTRALSFVAVDEPQGFASSVPPVVEPTGPFAIIRFHGRNAETWEKKGLASSPERFDHYYTSEQMQPWVPIISRLLESDVLETHALMNTNNGDQGPINALLLAHLVGEGLPGTGPRTMFDIWRDHPEFHPQGLHEVSRELEIGTLRRSMDGEYREYNQEQEAELVAAVRAWKGMSYGDAHGGG